MFLSLSTVFLSFKITTFDDIAYNECTKRSDTSDHI